MKRGRKNWDARLLDRARHTTVRHRHKPAVFGLTTLTVLLAITGLVVDLRVGSWRLAYFCYAAAFLSGTVLLAFLYNKRLRVARHPER